MPDQPTPPRRPRSAKCAAILAAARALFLQHGFAATSVDAVTEAAGVSKPTVYSHFPTKEALLEAVVRDEPDGFEIPPELRPTGDARADLERLARLLMTLGLSPESLAWDRMMASEARRRPELGRIFYDAGPGRLLGLLATFFRELHAAGSLDIDDPDQAAEFFFGLVLGIPLLKAQLTGETPSARQVTRRCRALADRFLRAYPPKSKAD